MNKKIIITEEDKDHIINLYEQPLKNKSATYNPDKNSFFVKDGSKLNHGSGSAFKPMLNRMEQIKNNGSEIIKNASFKEIITKLTNHFLQHKKIVGYEDKDRDIQSGYVYQSKLLDVWTHVKFTTKYLSGSLTNITPSTQPDYAGLITVSAKINMKGSVYAIAEGMAVRTATSIFNDQITYSAQPNFNVSGNLTFKVKIEKKPGPNNNTVITIEPYNIIATSSDWIPIPSTYWNIFIKNNKIWLNFGKLFGYSLGSKEMGDLSYDLNNIITNKAVITIPNNIFDQVIQTKNMSSLGDPSKYMQII